MNPPKLLIDDTVEISPFCTVGQDGFYYQRDEKGKLIKGEDKFGVILHKDVYLGAHVNVARGRWRDTEIGEGTKVDTFAQISHNVVIGKHNIIATHATILGSVTIGDNCDVWSNCVIHQGITIGNNCVISANEFVKEDVPDNHIYIGGRVFRNLKMGKKVEKKRGGVSTKSDCLNGKCGKNTDW